MLSLNTSVIFLNEILQPELKHKTDDGSNNADITKTNSRRPIHSINSACFVFLESLHAFSHNYDSNHMSLGIIIV